MSRPYQHERLKRARARRGGPGCRDSREYQGSVVQGPRPNLFLIGSMKSGTSYLRDLLAAHPSVFMSLPKEPCHFADPQALRSVWTRAWAQGYWRSVDRYVNLFAAAGEAAVIGEASTVYTQAPVFSHIAERILDFNPSARFIYVMRDPVERTISHYWHRVRWWGEHRSMLWAIRSDPHYRAVSHYAYQLNEYLRHVGRERIYTLTHEALLADPAGQLTRLYAWLGVDASFRPRNLGVPNNVLPGVMQQVRGLGLLDRFRHTATYLNLARHVPGPLRRFGSVLATRPVRPTDVDSSAVAAFLRPQQQLQTEQLGTLLKRSFPEWETLHAQDESGLVAVRAAG
jgi:hypothetical protein